MPCVNACVNVHTSILDYMAENSARSDDAVPTCHGQPAPHVDEAQLAASRHACHIVRDVCTFNATLFPRKPVNEKVRSLQVRSPSYSHHSLALHEWFGLKPAIAGSQAAALVRRRLRRHGYSACVPLIWLPVWALNFYETMQNSVPPLHEMLVTTRALDRRVLLRPDLGHSVWWWRRPKYIDALLQPFSTHSVRMLREVAPVCLPHQAEATLRRDDNHTRRCTTECFSQLVVCSPKSVFDEDRFAQPSSPYRAAQYVAARHLNGEGTAEAANAGATAGAEAPAAAPAAASSGAAGASFFEPPPKKESFDGGASSAAFTSSRGSSSHQGLRTPVRRICRGAHVTCCYLCGGLPSLACESRAFPEGQWSCQCGLHEK